MKRFILASFIMALLALLSFNFAYAFMFCSKPDVPYCLDAYGTFENGHTFQDCKDEMGYYLDEVEDYEECMLQEIQTTRREANDAIERFNCKASGSSFCP